MAPFFCRYVVLSVYQLDQYGGDDNEYSGFAEYLQCGNSGRVSDLVACGFSVHGGRSLTECKY